MVNKSNQNISFQGKKLSVTGRQIKEGDSLPKFIVSDANLSDLDQSATFGKPTILLSVPSVDTPVCAIETKRFSQEIEKRAGKLQLITVSMDLPFALKRFCSAENITNLITTSDYKHRSFGESFGVYIQEMGLLARAVFVADPSGKVVHVEYVDDISHEPDYAQALAAADKL